MKDIVKIMEFVFQNPDTCSPDELKKMFGEESYSRFLRFASHPSRPYIKGQKLNLTSEGVREYHRLISQQQRVEREETLIYVLSIFTIALTTIALGNIFNWYTYIIPEGERIYAALGFTFVVVIVALLILRKISGVLKL